MIWVSAHGMIVPRSRSAFDSSWAPTGCRRSARSPRLGGLAGSRHECPDSLRQRRHAPGGRLGSHRPDVHRPPPGGRSGGRASARPRGRPGLRHPSPRRPGPGGVRLRPRGARPLGRASWARTSATASSARTSRPRASTSMRPRWGSAGGSAPACWRSARSGSPATTSRAGWASPATTTPDGSSGSPPAADRGPTSGCWRRASLAAGDAIEVVHRPGHGVSVATMFRALITDHALLPELLRGRRARDRGARAGREVRRDRALTPRSGTESRSSTAWFATGP